MEFVDGETLESFIRREGPVSPVMALRITLQVTRALGAATRHHLVHRDIKPANLMLVKDDDDFLVKVIDFGLAKSIKHTERRGSGNAFNGRFCRHSALRQSGAARGKGNRCALRHLFSGCDALVHAGRTGAVWWLARASDEPAPSQGPTAGTITKCAGVFACPRGAHDRKKSAQAPADPIELRVAIEKCLAQVASEQNFPAPIDEACAEIQHERRTRPKVARVILWSIAAVVVLLGFGALLSFKRNWPTGIRAPRTAVTSPFSALSEAACRWSCNPSRPEQPRHRRAQLRHRRTRKFGGRQLRKRRNMKPRRLAGSCSGLRPPAEKFPTEGTWSRKPRIVTRQIAIRRHGA